MKRENEDFIIHEDNENEQVFGTLKGEKSADFIQKAKGLPTKPLYKLFLREYMKHTQPTVLAGCSRCDSRVKAITQQNVNSIRLQKLIKWKKLPNQAHGIFVYEREHLAFLKCLQSGQNMSETRMIKLSEKLNKMPASKQFLNFVAATDFENNYTQWYSDIPREITKNKKIHCIPYLVVFNKNSTSSPLRLVQQANSKFKSVCDEKYCPCVSERTRAIQGGPLEAWSGRQEDQPTPNTGEKGGPPNTVSDNHGAPRHVLSDKSNKKECVQKISYNTCIPQYNTALPPLQKLALQTKLSIRTSGADLAKFFRALENGIETQLLNMVHMYKCNISGRPTFDKIDKNGSENRMEMLLHKRQLWGLADLPSASIMALGLSFNTYKTWILSDTKHKITEAQILHKIGIPNHFMVCKQCEKVYDYILHQVKTLIFTKIYVDDIVSFLSLKSTLEYLNLQKLS